MKYRVTENTDFGDLKIQLYSTETPNEEAHYALQILERWGLVCATDDGEDTIGRARVRALQPEEAAIKAFDIARAAFREARERGLMLVLPDLDEVNKEEKNKQESRKRSHAEENA